MGALEVEVGHHHGACTVCRKALRNRTADPAGAAGHDGDLVPYVHEYLLVGKASVSLGAPLVSHAGDTRALAGFGLVSGSASKSYFNDFTVRPMTTSDWKPTCKFPDSRRSTLELSLGPRLTKGRQLDWLGVSRMAHAGMIAVRSRKQIT